MIIRIDPDIEKKSTLKAVCIFIAIAKTYEDALAYYNFPRQDTKEVLNQWLLSGQENILAGMERLRHDEMIRMQYGYALMLNEDEFITHMLMDEEIYGKGCELFAERYRSFGQQHYHGYIAQRYEGALSTIQQNMACHTGFSWAGLRTYETAMLLFFHFLHEKKEYFTERTAFLHILEEHYNNQNQSIHASGITRDEIPPEKLLEWDSIWDYDDFNRKEQLMQLFMKYVVDAGSSTMCYTNEGYFFNECMLALDADTNQQTFTNFENNNLASINEYYTLLNRYNASLYTEPRRQHLTEEFICSNFSWIRDYLQSISSLRLNIETGIYQLDPVMANENFRDEVNYPLSLLKIDDEIETQFCFCRDKELTRTPYRDNYLMKLYNILEIIPLTLSADEDVLPPFSRYPSLEDGRVPAIAPLPRASMLPESSASDDMQRIRVNIQGDLLLRVQRQQIETQRQQLQAQRQQPQAQQSEPPHRGNHGRRCNIF